MKLSFYDANLSAPMAFMISIGKGNTEIEMKLLT